MTYKKQTGFDVIADLKNILHKKGITQDMICKKTGIAQPNISRMMNDKKFVPSMKTILKICQVAGIEIQFKDSEKHIFRTTINIKN
jgi:transcriptional regulator with XRE-family HTH domain